VRMKILVRTDASVEIGNGHLMRCLTLADQLRSEGAEVVFVCRDLPGGMLDLLHTHGYQFAKLPLDEASKASQQFDAEQTIKAAEQLFPEGVDWLVVDHYQLDAVWERELRPHTDKLMVIDDMANRPHDCDLLLDQNMVALTHTRYADKVSAACGMLLGPEYALLQPIYAELHDRIPPREGSILRIFIFFGGADRHNLTGRTLAAFLQLNRPEVWVDVVITTSNPHVETIRQQVAGHGNIHLYSDLPTLASLMVKADLAIGAGGVTSWERLCLGLPTLVVTLSENQRPIADGLQEHSLIRWLGHHDEVDKSSLAKALSELLQEGLNEDWSLRCLAVVDGNGVNRVCAALTVTATTPLRVRHARLEDEAMLLEWANDPTARLNAFSPELISAETHRNWLHARLCDLESCRLYLVETEESVPVGQVRFDHKDQTWRIDYALAPHFRGRGLGRPLLEAALLKLREDEPGALVLGKVKDSNQASCRVFESLGFGAQINGGGEVEYRRVL
jgi:UDP-2,4-diacetamido-2,4,6-trideoxy-beta-L-altropyranose hydrolase